jgi:hypothetical protein
MIDRKRTLSSRGPIGSRRIFFHAIGAIGAVVTISSSGAFAAPIGESPTAAASVVLEFDVIQGEKTGKSSLPAKYPSLAKAPWNTYDTYSITQTKKLTLVLGNGVVETLPDGSTVEATLMPAKSAPKVTIDLVVKGRTGVQLLKSTWSSPKGQPYLPLSLPYKDGNLVPGLTVVP